MATNFKIGDLVEVLDEPLQGKIIAINGSRVEIETDDGLPLQFEKNQLIKISGPIAVSNFEVAQIKKQKEEKKRRPSKTVKPKERNAPKMEVDLHIHQLVKSTRGLSNFEMLEIQLETAKRQLEFAMSKRIQKVVFIHGVGEGVLKEELNYLFKKYDNVKFYDAEYRKYGLGATEVYIYQNT